MAHKAKKDEPDGVKIICRNKRAFHEYEVFDTLECGLVLTGTEVKSLREGSASLDGAYARIEDGELWLLSSDIPEYSMGNRLNHKPKRKRKLLLHRREIEKLDEASSQEGYTILPLEVYLKSGRIKVELGVCKGKKQYDKRQDQKRKDAAREVEAALRRRDR